MNNLPASSQFESIKEGDVIQIGPHVLGCGKAGDGILLEKLLQERKINLILADPPYACNYVDGKQVFSKLSHKTDIVNDQAQSEKEYIQFSRVWMHAVSPHLAIPNSVYVFNTDKMAFAVKQAIEIEGGKYSQLLIWAKNQSVIGRLDYNPQHELIVYGWFGKHTFYKSKDKSVLCFPKPHRSKLHPTMKPIPLLRHLILNSSRMGDIVWDGFGGSGSTMIASQQTRRICVMTEVSPEYCRLIITRMQDVFPDLPITKLAV
ncbi:MAG: site-specific DNA-methyltransferase [Patescibacteria group bacterium]